jgi:hypothetical protein
VPAAGFRRPACKPAAHICRADRIDTDGRRSRVGRRGRCFMVQVQGYRGSVRIRVVSGRNRSPGQASKHRGQEGNIESAPDPAGHVRPFLTAAHRAETHAAKRAAAAKTNASARAFGLRPAGSCITSEAVPAASVDGFPLSPTALQVLNSAQDALPDHDPCYVAGLTQFVGPLGGSCRGVRPVVRDQ